jgi:dethiobiotin synthetase
MARTSGGVFITGTDTGVGKTFVAALLVRALKERGLRPGYVKSMATGVEGNLCEDVDFAKRYGAVEGELHDLCPIRLKLPASPYAAAQAENVELELDEVLRAYERCSKTHDFTVVEGVGGLLVPITRDKTVLDLIGLLALPVLVVCRPGLGTVNHTLLTLQTLDRAGAETIGFVTCGERMENDPTIPQNPSLIEEFSRAAFFGHIPFCGDPDRQFGQWTHHVSAVLDSLLR